MKNPLIGSKWEGIRKIQLTKIRKYYLLILVLILFTACIDLSLILLLSLLFLSAGVITHSLIKVFTACSNKRNRLTRIDKNYLPFVSIQVACCNESASIVNKTLEYLNKLDYEKYEVLVIHNNNNNKDNWSQIRSYAKTLGRKFKFYHVNKISGFKAGALGYLQRYQNKKTEIIAIVDSDYIVKPCFLKKTVGYFADPKVSIVQIPQDYKNVDSDNEALKIEYSSFFSVFMNQAHQANAVTFTGTMGLIRAKLFKNRISWNKKCITEDIEIGIKINRLGHRGVYLDKSLGKGLMPFDYNSLTKQRKRWVYGNMQILQKDLFKILLEPNLNFWQKLSIISQLTAWFHFELIIAAAYLVIVLISLTPLKDNLFFAASDKIIMPLLLIPVLANLIFFLVGLRGKFSPIERMRAFFAHYSLAFTMSASWIKSLFGDRLPFQITSKEKSDKKTACNNWQAYLISALLITALITKVIANQIESTDIIAIVFIIVEIYCISAIKQSLR